MIRKITKIFLISTSLFLFGLQNSNAEFNSKLSKMLQDTLNYYVSTITNIKGMSASVYYPGQGIWKGTSGVSYPGQSITSDMEFGIASNSKLFVSTAILKLSENNKISLDDSLHKWLPAFKNVNPNITIRQLLQHTSGVSDPYFISPFVDTISKNPTRFFTPEEVLSYLGAPQFSPGASFYYSNINYLLAGMVAESASGFSISRIIRDSILTALNLDSTFFDVEENVLGKIAHRWYNSVDFHDTSRVALNSAVGGAGAIFSTSSEMAQWYHALFSGQILDSNSFAELTHFIDIKSAFTYGLGLQQQDFFGHNTWGHGGRTWGYKSRMVYDPATGAVVCGLTNSDPSGVDGVTLLLYKVLVDNLPAVAGAITGQQKVCQGQNSVTYSVSKIANANSYKWSLPNGAIGISSTNSIVVNYGLTSVSGNITVRGINTFGDGNPSSLAIKVNPIYNFIENQIICAGDTLNWHGQHLTLSNTYTSNYISINGCDSIYTINLNVTSPYYFSEEHTICAGDTLNWHGRHLTSSNTYTAKYISMNGCDSIYTINLNVTSPYYFSEEHTICAGDTLNWHGIECYDNGKYVAEYKTINGCDSIYVLNLKVDKIPTGVSINGITLSADSISNSYQWLDCDNHNEPIMGAIYKDFTPSKSGNYSVRLTVNNCSDTSDCFQLTITDVENAASFTNEISITPNPASDCIEINYGNIGACFNEIWASPNASNIKIYNILGECLINYELQITNYDGIGRIDISHLSVGLYFIQVGNYTEKFVVVR